MPGAVHWIDQLLLFQVQKTYATQCLCVCAAQYQAELDLRVDDILFLADRHSPRRFRRLGKILALPGANKVIVRILPDIGIGSKLIMQTRHQLSL